MATLFLSAPLPVFLDCLGDDVVKALARQVKVETSNNVRVAALLALGELGYRAKLELSVVDAARTSTNDKVRDAAEKAYQQIGIEPNR